MEKGALTAVAALVFFLIFPGSLLCADPKGKTANPTISGSQKSGSTQLDTGSSSGGKVSQKTTISTGASPTSQASEKPGYCCKEGELKETTKNACLKKIRGKFYPNLKSGLAGCRGWCCDELKVSRTNSPECRKVQGRYFAGKPEADRFCAAQKGWCCADGKLARKTQAECKAKGQKFFTSELAARKSCKAERVFCCMNGEIVQATKNECLKKQGTAYPSQKRARDSCGWCCTGGRITQVADSRDKQQCAAKEGVFYLERAQALKVCRIQKGYCLTDGKITRLDERSCIKLKGSYFTTSLAAQKQKSMLKTSGVKNDQKDDAALPGSQISGLKKAPKSDLSKTDPRKTDTMPPGISPHKSKIRLVPKTSEQGIRVTLAGDGVFQRGDTIGGMFTITRSVSDDTPIVLSLRNRTNRTLTEFYRIDAGDVGRPTSYEWIISMSTGPSEGYTIYAQAGDLYGESSSFAIREGWAGESGNHQVGIHAYIDSGRRFFSPGETINLKYRYMRGEPDWPQRVQIYIHRREDSMDRIGFWALVWQIERGGETYDTTTHEFTVPIRLPDREEYQVGEWVFSVIKSSSLWARTNQFSIGMIGEGGSDGPGTGISLMYPVGGEHWTGCCDQPYTVVWHHWGSGPVPNTSIELMRRGRGVRAWRVNASGITFNEITRECRATIEFESSSEGVPAGSDYTLRVSAAGETAESGHFTIGGGLLVEGPFLSYRGETLQTRLHWAVDYEVRWRSLAVIPSSVDVLLLNELGHVIERLGTVRESAGRFEFPATAGTRIKIVNSSNDDMFGVSSEFQVQSIDLSIISPRLRDRWRNGSTVSIAWEIPHLPRYHPEEGVPFTVSIDLVRREVPVIRECIGRNVPANLGTLRWNVRYGSCIDYGTEAAVLEGEPLPYGTGTMGGVPDDLPPGRYMVEIVLNPGGFRRTSQEFFIE